MYIYKTVCLLNSKIYIGQCSKHPDKSINYLGSGVLISRAIKIHGKQNFKKEILRVCKSQKELDAFEEIFIKRFDSTNEEIGYNILPGTSNRFGSGSPMLIAEVVEKYKKTIKEFHKTEAGAKFRKNISDKAKERMSHEENRKTISDSIKSLNQKGENNPNYGNKWSEEKKKELSETFSDGRRKGENNSNFGNRWSEEKKTQLSNKITNKFNKIVVQLDLFGNEIARFDGLVDAENKTGIKRDKIVLVAGGFNKTGGGFKWKYEDKEDTKNSE